MICSPPDVVVRHVSHLNVQSDIKNAPRGVTPPSKCHMVVSVCCESLSTSCFSCSGSISVHLHSGHRHVRACAPHVRSFALLQPAAGKNPVFRVCSWILVTVNKTLSEQQQPQKEEVPHSDFLHVNPLRQFEGRRRRRGS